MKWSLYRECFKMLNDQIILLGVVGCFACVCVCVCVFVWACYVCVALFTVVFFVPKNMS